MLRGLTSYQRACVLQQAECLWAEGNALTSADERLLQAEEDVNAVVTQWLGEVLRRLSPEARCELVERAKELDDLDRLHRLLQNE